MRCAKCQEEKEETDFYKKSKRNTYHSYCKVCLKQWSRTRHREAVAKLITLKGGKCRDCGNSDFRVLAFHHEDPTKKEFGISASANRSFEKLVKEVEKCVLLCHNCHAIVHYALEADKE